MPRGHYDRTRFKNATVTTMPSPMSVDGEVFESLPVPQPSIEGADYYLVTAPTVELPIIPSEWKGYQASSDPVPVHPLESAPIGSNITVNLHVPEGKIVWLSTTGEDGHVTRLPTSDPAQRLPEGAFIRKEGEKKFHARQNGGGTDAPDLFTETAAEAIARFMPHFHNAAV